MGSSAEDGVQFALQRTVVALREALERTQGLGRNVSDKDRTHTAIIMIPLSEVLPSLTQRRGWASERARILRRTPKPMPANSRTIAGTCSGPSRGARTGIGRSAAACESTNAKELWDCQSPIRPVAQTLDAGDERLDKPISDSRRSLLARPASDGLQDRYRRLGETNGGVVHLAT